jgi:predicted metal-binding protein
MDDRRDMYPNLEKLFKDHGFNNYKWINPSDIVVAQWVRMKCMFGCPNYGSKAACPPQTPSVSECERFFEEYSSAVVFHIRVQFDDPEDRFDWYKDMALKLVELERQVFLAGFERALFLLFGGCQLCEECTVKRSQCKQPRLARPSAEGMAVDVYSTVKKLEFPISVRTEMAQAMDRYVFLMVN